jgi:hypothetical protein
LYYIEKVEKVILARKRFSDSINSIGLRRPVGALVGAGLTAPSEVVHSAIRLQYACSFASWSEWSMECADLSALWSAPA